MRKIRDGYFYPEMEKLGAEVGASINLPAAEERFVVDSLDFNRAVTVADDTMMIEYFEHLVFEGAQGLRLDQYSEDFPHVTRSSTGLENVAALVGDADLKARYGFDKFFNVHY